MALIDAVERIEAKVAEAAVTLRELAALVAAGTPPADLEARLNAAADALEAAENETDPTPDNPAP